MEAAPLPSRSGGVSSLISGTHDYTNLFNSRRKNFLDNDAERCLCRSIAVHQGLQRKCPLVFGSGGDNCFLDFHGFGFYCTGPKMIGALQNRKALP